MKLKKKLRGQTRVVREMSIKGLEILYSNPYIWSSRCEVEVSMIISFKISMVTISYGDYTHNCLWKQRSFSYLFYHMHVILLAWNSILNLVYFFYNYSGYYVCKRDKLIVTISCHAIGFQVILSYSVHAQYSNERRGMNYKKTWTTHQKRKNHVSQKTKLVKHPTLVSLLFINLNLQP